MKKYFEQINDPRQSWKIEHKLDEIVIMTIVAVVCGLDIWEDIADYCKAKIDWFREQLKLELVNGVASHDTFQRVFQLIKPTELENCFRSWVSDTVKITNGEIVGIDGKTLCGSRDKKTKAIHMVSAWASANKVVLGQMKTNEKSNEITAIPTLINLLELHDCIVTIDAMGCQTKIVETIVEAGADYVIGLKGNQENMLNEAKRHFEDDTISRQEHKTENKGHGREERREYSLITEFNDLEQKENWSELNGFGKVKSIVIEKGKLSEETRYFITSITKVETFLNAVRGHWGIENNLHWSLDVSFNEDDSRIRKDNSPENFAVIRHLVLNALNMHPSKMSLARKRRRCQYDPQFLLDILAYML